MPPRRAPAQPRHSDNVKHRIFYQIMDPLPPAPAGAEQDQMPQGRIQELDDHELNTDAVASPNFLAASSTINESPLFTGSFAEQTRQYEEWKRQQEQQKQREAAQSVEHFSDPLFWANLDVSKTQAPASEDPFRMTLPIRQDSNYGLQGPGIFSPDLNTTFESAEEERGFQALQEWTQKEKEKEAIKTATAAVINTPTRARSVKDTSKQHLPIQKLANTWQIHRRKVTYKDGQKTLEDDDPDVQMMPPPTPTRKTPVSHARRASASATNKRTSKTDNVPPVPPLSNAPPTPIEYRFQYEMMPPTPSSVTSPGPFPAQQTAPATKPDPNDKEAQYFEWLNNCPGAIALMNHDKKVRERVYQHRTDWPKFNQALLKINAILNITELSDASKGPIRARRDFPAGWQLDLHGATSDPTDIKLQAKRNRPTIINRLEDIELSGKVAMREWNENQKQINLSMSAWCNDAIPGSTYLCQYGDMDKMDSPEFLQAFTQPPPAPTSKMPTPSLTTSSMSMSSPVLGQTSQQHIGEPTVPLSYVSEMVREIQEMRLFLERNGMPPRQPPPVAAQTPQPQMTPSMDFQWDFDIAMAHTQIQNESVSTNTNIDMSNWPLSQQYVPGQGVASPFAAGMQSPGANQQGSEGNAANKDVNMTF